jgi:hypothetical protein
MLRKLIAKLRVHKPGRDHAKLYVTLARTREIFAFGRSRGITGFVFPETEAIGLARIIDWQPDSQS